MSPNNKNNKPKEKPLLLFSPLDWGLGHTTRSIPLISELLNQGCQILVACNSTQRKILEGEFPDLEFEELEGYRLNYGRNALTTKIKLALQVVKILTRIKYENRWLASLITRKQVDAAISDNRYGIFSPGIPCIFISHQLKVKSGFGWMADKLVQKILYSYINKFTSCWVPDFENKENLAGELSHPHHRPKIPLHYIGCVSRLYKCSAFPKTSPDYCDILIILSGPEPQRSILEEIMIDQLKSYKRKVVLVRGLPGESSGIKGIEGVEIFNHVTAEKLNQLVCNAGLIICRSGYTTIMDMLKLRKKMIVIPTPGQSEQEYLASHLSDNNLAISVRQSKFSIVGAEKLASDFDFRFIEQDMDQYKTVIKEFAERLKMG